MPATSSVAGSRAELATLPWLLLVLLSVSEGAFKLGVVREEPFAKFSKLCPGSFEMQDEKLCISQTYALEISAERLTETLKRGSKGVAQAANQRGEECSEGNPFFLRWPETVGNGFWGGSVRVATRCSGF